MAYIPHPQDMRTNDHLNEVAQLLTEGIMRLRQRHQLRVLSSQLALTSGEIALDCAPIESGDGRVELTRRPRL